eukprot:m.429268 g.429268  ORF g.429268 m.429268 type:complete len:296 (+) comp16981_c0_seq1:855-1742(+)
MNLILLRGGDWVERTDEEGDDQGGPAVTADAAPLSDARSSASEANSEPGGVCASTIQVAGPQAESVVVGVALLTDERRVTHIHTVIKAAVGDTLKVGEVDGLMGTAVVLAGSHESYRLRVRLSVLPPPPSPVTLVLALPERTVFTQVLHQVTVLGVKRVYVIGAAAVPASEWGAHQLQREAIAETLTLGLEQTIDTTMPRVYLRQDTARFVRSELPELLAESRGLMLARQPGETVQLDECHKTTEPTTLLVGPLANFTEVEEQRFQELGFKPVSFGPRALQVTAAVHALVGRMTL